MICLRLASIGLERPLPVELDDLLVARPAIPGLVAILHEVVDQRIFDAGRGRVGEEHIPAALRRRRLGGAALDQGRPVHRQDVDSEAHARSACAAISTARCNRVVGLIHERQRAPSAPPPAAWLLVFAGLPLSSGSMPGRELVRQPQPKIAAHT